MNNIFIIAGIISVIYFIAKFIEMRFIEKESKPLKHLIRDSLLVYFSVLIGNFVSEQVSPVLEIVHVSNPVAFTDNPGF